MRGAKIYKYENHQNNPLRKCVVTNSSRAPHNAIFFKVQSAMDTDGAKFVMQRTQMCCLLQLADNGCALCHIIHTK